MTKRPFNFRITDHVLLRYMERMLGVDVADFRKRLHVQLEPSARAGVASHEVAGMVFKFSHSPNESVVATMWPSGHVCGHINPPKAAKQSREAMKIIARKRMAK